MARKERGAWVADLRPWGGGRVRCATEAQARALEAAQKKERLGYGIGRLLPAWAARLYVGTANEVHAVRITDEIVSILGPHMSILDLKDAAVQRLEKAWAEKGNKRSTIRSKLTILSKLLNWGVKTDEVPEMVSKPAIVFGKVTGGRTRVLQPAEEDILFANLLRLAELRPQPKGGRPVAYPEDERTYHFYRFLLYTGCRPSEARRMVWDNVDWDGGLVTFEKTKTDEPRTIPMHDIAREALTWTWEQGWSTPWEGIDDHCARRCFYVARKAAGLGPDVTPYVLRHTCGTRLGKAGLGELRVQMWMGHSNLETTKRYTHFNTEDLKEGLTYLSRRPGPARSAPARPGLTVVSGGRQRS